MASRRLIPGWRWGVEDPHGPKGPRGESPGPPSVGLNSFGPNPTANLAGAKERGHPAPGGAVSIWQGPSRAARGWSATVGLHLCGLLGKHSGAVSGYRAGDCIPSEGLEVRCGTGSLVVVAPQKKRCAEQMNALTPRRQSRVESTISDEMMAFQHEFVGRGPERIRTRIVANGSKSGEPERAMVAWRRFCATASLTALSE